MALRGRGFTVDEIQRMDLFRIRSYVEILTAKPGKGKGKTTRYVVKRR